MNIPQTLYERIYFHEISTWHNITGQLQLLLAILTGVFGFTIKIGSDLVNITSTNHYSMWLIITWAIFGGGVVKLYISSSLFWQAWHGYDYKHIINTERIDNYYKEFLEYFSNYQNKETLALNGLRLRLEEQFRDYATIAAENNGRKFEHLYESKLELIVAVVSFAMIYILLRVIG